jgi:predicted NBD/HSP70 family sugar kinase
VPEPRSTGGRGRPSTAYRRAALGRPVGLIRLRHHHRTTLALIANDGTVTSVESAAHWSQLWDQWSPTVAGELANLEADAGIDAESGAGVRQVVMAVPFPARSGQGAPDRFRGVPDWLRTDPLPAVTGLFGRPAAVVNDANLAALGEANYGAGRDCAHVLHVSVRDGIGAGLVFDGALLTGAHGMAGELAHVQVVENGPFCMCGNRGCLATQTLDPIVVETLTSRYAHPLSFADVDDLVRNGDVVAVRFFTEVGALVGRPLAAIVTVLDPDVVVIDAELGAASSPFIAGLRGSLDQRCMPGLVERLDLRRGQLTDPVALGALAVANAAL